MRDTVEVALEVVGNASASREACAIVEDRLDLGGNVHVQECCGQIPVTCSTADQNGKVNSDEMTICQEFSHSLSLDRKVQKCLIKSKTFPLSKELQADPSSISYEADSTAISLQNQVSGASGTSAYARSMSCPLSSNLIPATKGSRALHGKVTTSEFRVKWAPEVYDPPATTVSHTVKSHQPRPKSKKDKHNKRKGKSSRGNGGDKKRGNCRSLNKIPELMSVRLQENGDKQVVDVFSKRKVVDFSQYGMNDAKVTCGSSFLREELSNVHLPIGEAS